MKKIFLSLIIFCISSFTVYAGEIPDRTNISDWYIKDFKTEISVQPDRSLNIIEQIVADCGNLSGKHGIFRIVPKSVERAGKAISLPIKLIGITDFNGGKYVYDSSLDYMNNTQIWKIGDPEKTVKGENDYQIEYILKNAVYTLGKNEDELYWNILGNFWELEIDNFTAKISLPSGLTKTNTSVALFSGEFGVKDNLLNADYLWTSENTLEILATGVKNNQGVSISLLFPKGIFEVENVSNFWIYFTYLLFIIPILVFILAFKIWKKNGKDFKNNKSIIPEYYPPKGMSILEMGAILKNGKIKKEFLSAEIINLAVKGFLTIEMKKLFWFFGKTYVLTTTENNKKTLSEIEEKILNALFSGKKQVSLSKIKESFYLAYKNISKDVITKIDKEGYLNKKSLKIQKIFIVLGSIFLFSLIYLGSFYITMNEVLKPFIAILFLSILPIGPIFLIFGMFMAQRTQKGEEILNSIKGFKMYMQSAEKHRQQFYEQENIFEKYLPYAVMFGITKKWISAFKNIYGPEYFDKYAPLWIVGSNINFSNMNSLSGFISSVSSDIGGSLGSSSSSSSGGSSGGGGGGGGGGGW